MTKKELIRNIETLLAELKEMDKKEKKSFKTMFKSPTGRFELVSCERKSGTVIRDNVLKLNFGIDDLCFKWHTSKQIVFSRVYDGWDFDKAISFSIIRPSYTVSEDNYALVTEKGE